MSKDQYEVLETIGTGSFGTVCKLKRKSDGKILVWKDINFGKMSEKEKTQLVAEVNILRELRNPFIVRYHDRIVDKPSTRLYIIMEFCAGGDLGRVIKKCKRERTYLDEQLVWKVFGQAIVALKDCHRRMEHGDNKPIIHRDLKPANILLDSNQNIKIGDFGLAKELSSQSKLAQTNVGTPYYMAPEIINERDYDERSDIWSLGCLLYELAALRPPFDASNAVSLAVKINAGKFPRIPTKYSDPLFDAIKMMLQVDPKKRPRVGDLETLAALQPALTAAKTLAGDFQMQQTYATKWRELKAREETVTAREEELKKREEAVAQQESALQEREKALLHNQQQHHHHQQQQQQQYGAPAGTVMDEHQQQQHIGNPDFERRLQQHASKPRRASTEQMVVDRRQSIDMMSVAEGPSRRQSTEAMTVDDGCRDGDSDAESVATAGGFKILIDRSTTGAAGTEMPAAVRKARDTLMGAGGASAALAMRAAPSVPTYHRSSVSSVHATQGAMLGAAVGPRVGLNAGPISTSAVGVAVHKPQKMLARAAHGRGTGHTGGVEDKENVHSIAGSYEDQHRKATHHTVGGTAALGFVDHKIQLLGDDSSSLGSPLKRARQQQQQQYPTYVSNMMPSAPGANGSSLAAATAGPSLHVMSMQALIGGAGGGSYHPQKGVPAGAENGTQEVPSVFSFDDRYRI